jgi:hypothetical protein
MIFLFGFAALGVGLWIRRRSYGVIMRSQANGLILGGSFLICYGVYAVGAWVLSL